MKEGEIQGYSHKEADRLGRFNHILERASAAEKAIEQGRELHYVLRGPGTPDDHVFSMDRHYVDTLKKMAGDIYNSDFADNPRLKDAAMGIVAHRHEGQVREQQLEPGQEASLRRLLGDEGERR